jgi:hypothetical protein
MAHGYKTWLIVLMSSTLKRAHADMQLRPSDDHNALHAVWAFSSNGIVVVVSGAPAWPAGQAPARHTFS